ncbi:MAG: GNAT family N-acetyltransferase [Deltaproteobacteria bacterium]|nr:GNAT family N-acetyltransferase [Deltaproteobacteria bacterium]
MDTGLGWRLLKVPWETHQAALLAIRFEVFVEGQDVPLDEEVDGLDPDCVHVLVLTDDGEPVATGRLLPDAHIGRMAVRAPWRGKGLGGAVLEALVRVAGARGDDTVVLAAQTHAIPFYARHGFRVYGPVFDDAGIDHRWMDRAASPG